MMRIINSKSLQKYLEDSLPVLLYFWSNQCYGCVKAEPCLNRLEEAYKGKIKMLKINSEKELELAGKFRIQILPTFLIFHGMKLVCELRGFKNEMIIEKEIRNII